MKITKLRMILVLLLAVLFCVVSAGCDEPNSDSAWEWDDGGASKGGDAMQEEHDRPGGGGGVSGPPHQPNRPQSTQSNSNSASNSSSASNSTNTGAHTTHDWVPEYEQTSRKVRRTVEEVIYTCSVCGSSTNNMRDADSHANTLHTDSSGHIISAGTQWGSVTVTKYQCNNCNTVFNSQAEWQTHSNNSSPHNWDENATANYRTVCSVHPDAVLDTGAAIDAHVSGENACPAENLQDVYTTPIPCSCGGALATHADQAAHPITGPVCTACSAITTSEPVPETVYRCSCGNVFYSNSQADRHVTQSGPGNPPYAYSSDRKNVEKEVTVYDRTLTGRTVCSVCKAPKPEEDENS